MAVLDDVLLCTYTNAEVTWGRDGNGIGKPSDEGISKNRCSANKVFYDLEELKKSLAKTKFSCDQCDYSTDRKYSLQVHLRTHSKIKPYVCTFCEKSFARSSDKTRHEKIHQGKKDHKCNFCSKAFSHNVFFIVFFRKVFFRFFSKSLNFFSTFREKSQKIFKILIEI